MRFLVLFILSMAVGMPAFGADNTPSVIAKAARAFDAGEWASAQALYGILSDRQPKSGFNYGRSIVASERLGDHSAATAMLERAMANSVPLDSVLVHVESESLALGDSKLYPTFLEDSRTAMPWLSRALDTRLLDYYTFRHDPEMMVEASRKMLRGLPDSTEYLSVLARGLMMLGRDSEAADTWRHILEIDPSNLDALLRLGNYLYASAPAEALELLKKANALSPSPYLQQRIERLDAELTKSDPGIRR